MREFISHSKEGYYVKAEMLGVRSVLGRLYEKSTSMHVQSAVIIQVRSQCICEGSVRTKGKLSILEL